MSKRRDLTLAAEKFAFLLLSEATDGKIGGTKDPSASKNSIDFKDRRALLDTITKLLKEKNAREPEDDTSSLGKFKEMMDDAEHGGETGSGGDSSPPPSSPASSDDADDDDLIA